MQPAHPPPPHTPLQWGDFSEGRYREDGQVLSLPHPWPLHGLMWQGREYGSPTPHQAAPPPPHLIAYWQCTCTGPVRQKGCGSECSWSRGRVRRRLAFAVGTQQQHLPLAMYPPLAGIAPETRGGERRREGDVKPG